MGNIKDSLARIESQQADGIDKLYGIFKSVPSNQLRIIRHTLHPGNRLIRQRLNLKGKSFSNVSQLSYPPSFSTTLGRVNLPENPMFYACSFPSDISDDATWPQIVAILENSSSIHYSSSSGIQRLTISRWLIGAPIELISLPFIGSYERPCPDLIKIRDEWNEAISKDVVSNDAIDLIKYMADEISKEVVNNEGYFKIANFVYYLLRICDDTKDADGIIYPSVAAKGAGFNVAIKPEAVDVKVHFLNASEYYALKQNDDCRFIPMKNAKVKQNGELVFIDRVLTASEQKYYDEYSSGIDFIN